MAFLVLSAKVGVVAAVAGTSTADEIYKVQQLNSYTSTVEYRVPAVYCNFSIKMQ
jgi:hypothetical protein